MLITTDFAMKNKAPTRALSHGWNQLREHYESIKTCHLNTFFDDNPNRASDLSLEAGPLFLDFSKNRINNETLTLLSQLAEKAGLQEAIEAMFSGETINTTEDRAVLHTALRAHCGKKDHPLSDTVQSVLLKMRNFVDAIHTGTWLGFTDKPITDIVNIGVGGSDLGPSMATLALTPYHTGKINSHFVSNIDGTDLSEKLRSLNAESTLFIVASKSFTTLETRSNADSAKQWMLQAGCSEALVQRHFVAVSSKIEKCKAFGIDAENVFPMWDWVGGRFSLWSAIGLPIALAIGMDHFEAMLEGAQAMDAHFTSAPLHQNMPVILGMLSIWYGNFFDVQSEAVIVYDQSLKRFPQYLQQLEMESLGKTVRKDGQPVQCRTGLAVWGGTGCNTQHSFHQLLHQGNILVPADFIIPLNSHNPIAHQHEHLFANCISQCKALMNGKTLAEAKAELLGQGLDLEETSALAPHKVIEGNKPSNLITFEELSPFTLGSLVALYEHKVFTQSVVWGINAFDQWGVELGKTLSKDIYQLLVQNKRKLDYDASTNAMINRFRESRLKTTDPKK